MTNKCDHVYILKTIIQHKKHTMVCKNCSDMIEVNYDEKKGWSDWESVGTYPNGVFGRVTKDPKTHLEYLRNKGVQKCQSLTN